MHVVVISSLHPSLFVSAHVSIWVSVLHFVPVNAHWSVQSRHCFFVGPQILLFGQHHALSGFLKPPVKQQCWLVSHVPPHGSVLSPGSKLLPMFLACACVVSNIVVIMLVRSSVISIRVVGLVVFLFFVVGFLLFVLVFSFFSCLSCFFIFFRACLFFLGFF